MNVKLTTQGGYTKNVSVSDTFNQSNVDECYVKSDIQIDGFEPNEKPIYDKVIKAEILPLFTFIY